MSLRCGVLGLVLAGAPAVAKVASAEVPSSAPAPASHDDPPPPMPEQAPPVPPAAPPSPEPATPPAETAPAPAPTPSPQPPVAAPSSPAVPRDPRSATVHLWSSHPGAWLELKDYSGSGEWRRECREPCDRLLPVLGSDVRVWAPGMTTSNSFRIEPGPGVAVVRVEGGSALLRTLGIAGLAIGVPLGLAGTGVYSYGRFSDDDGLAVAGGAALATGALTLLAALPMLIMGSTDVRDARGKLIAAGPRARATP